MSMKDLILQGLVREIPPNNARAKSLHEMSLQTLKVMLQLGITKENSSIIFRELYECLRQEIEAVGYRKGLKFENHESLKVFLEEVLANKPLANDFDRYRKIRNGINYYGDKVSVETAVQAAKDISRYIKELPGISVVSEAVAGGPDPRLTR
jgi:hypothetical protein